MLSVSVTPFSPIMPDLIDERARFCAYCGSPVVVPDAIYCKECGRALPNTVMLGERPPWSPGLAAALSVVPGLGHWYKGQSGRGIGWFIIVMLFYMAATPLGLTIHLICAANAAFRSTVRRYSDRAQRRRRRTRAKLVPMATGR
jgi:hypothetical protein